MCTTYNSSNNVVRSECSWCYLTLGSTVCSSTPIADKYNYTDLSLADLRRIARLLAATNNITINSTDTDTTSTTKSTTKTVNVATVAVSPGSPVTINQKKSFITFSNSILCENSNSELIKAVKNSDNNYLLVSTISTSQDLVNLNRQVSSKYYKYGSLIIFLS